MHRPPRPPGESLFARGLWQHVLLLGSLMAGACLGLQAWALARGLPLAQAQTLVFTGLVTLQMAYVLVIRSQSQPLWRLGLASNPWLLGAVLLTLALQAALVYLPPLQALFRTEALAPIDLLACGLVAFGVALAAEAEKAWRRRGTQPFSAARPSAGQSL